MRSRIYRSILKRVIKDRVQTIQELRLDSGLKAMPPAMLPKGIEFESVDIGGTEAEWLIPIGRSTEVVILHLHGGGYVSGSAELHRMLTSQLAKSLDARVLAPNYHLAPEHPFPAAIEDALEVYRYLLSTGCDPAELVVSGDSAGGGLALALVMRLRDSGEPLPAALVLMSPWTDLELKNPSCTEKAGDEALLTVPVLREWAREYAGGTRLDDPLLSPVNGDFSGFPPMLIQVGSEEILLDDARIVARKAEAAGVRVQLSVWEGLWHVWQVLGPLVPENEESFAEVSLFIRGCRDSSTSTR
jgi:acetyl esterase/lipase